MRVAQTQLSNQRRGGGTKVIAALRQRIRHVARSLLGDQVLGWLDYARFPMRRAGWGGPFNGQQYRQVLFFALIEKLQPAAIIETGTHLGTTTELFAQTNRPVFTIESNLRAYGFAQARLWRRRNVKRVLGDSREALRAILTGRLHHLTDAPLFVYLDAHWNADLPLAEEIDIIFSSCRSAAVMIDDFEVPGDAGYGFDSYGPSRTLNASYVAAAVREHRLATFYPSTPSTTETGKRRGCAVLCREVMLGEALRAIPLLRHARSAATPTTV